MGNAKSCEYTMYNGKRCGRNAKYHRQAFLCEEHIKYKEYCRSYIHRIGIPSVYWLKTPGQAVFFIEGIRSELACREAESRCHTEVDDGHRYYLAQLYTKWEEIRERYSQLRNIPYEWDPTNKDLSLFADGPCVYENAILDVQRERHLSYTPTDVELLHYAQPSDTEFNMFDYRKYADSWVYENVIPTVQQKRYTSS